jgi:glycosyltransferase involved in cell wall biosynthesis
VIDGLTARFGRQITVFSADVRNYGQAKYQRAPWFRGIRRIGLHDALASLAAAREQPAVFFSTFYGTARTTAAEVFTVYDLSVEMSTRQHPPKNRYLRKVIADTQHCLVRASALLAISQNTAHNILSLYPHVDPSKIAVTPLGVEASFFERPSLVARPRRRDYFLYVGYRGGHKNFMRLLVAFGESGLAGDFDLRVISPDAFDLPERECLRKYQLDASVHLEAHADDAALRDAYTSAVALVYPSLLEGFGLPLLEAMASGTLVLTSNTSCMPEVGGEVGYYFDPYDVESIAECLRRTAALSTEERQLRINQAIARARTFTWERCQQQTVAVFENLLG